MLVKSSPGVNFINVLHEAITRADPKCVKMTIKMSVFFALTLGKAACKIVVKLTPVIAFVVLI